MEKFEEEIGDSQCPRCYNVLRTVVWLAITAITVIIWGLVLSCISSCSPIITAPHGYVIKANTHQVAVEHERMDKPGYGVVRLYEFPFGHGYVVGDYFGVKRD